jgi:hypothetical protein
MQSRSSLRRSAHRGLSIVETAIMLVILGLMIEFVIKGRELVQNARVRDMISQQGAAEAAFLAFQDRFRAPPGDYPAADTNLSCGSFICLNGNGNGRVEPGTGGAIHEEILVWQHLVAAGFINGHYQMANAAVTSPAPDNTPSNVFGGYMQAVTDSVWGYSGNTASRSNIKTGNYVPASVLAEVDRKVDDGRPGTGRLRFSTFAGAGPAPALGGTPGGCTDADSTSASWLEANGSDNCGAATLLY